MGPRLLACPHISYKDNDINSLKERFPDTVARELQTSQRIRMATQSCSCDLSTSLLREGWRIRLRVSGWSMKPSIPTGSLVRIEPIAPKEIPPIGTVVLLELTDGRLLAHRLIAIRDTKLITKGDACATEDAPHPMSALRGLVVAVEEPNPRPLASALARRWGLALGWIYPRLVRLKSLGRSKSERKEAVA